MPIPRSDLSLWMLSDIIGGAASDVGQRTTADGNVVGAERCQLAPLLLA